MENNNTGGSTGGAVCGYKCGLLPECAPLALAYVPMQQSSMPSYEPGEALMRGTLFPGLDLPFMNIVNTLNVSDTPLGELMALHFVVDELKLYLDTHPDDREAFASLKSFLELTKEAHRRYVKRYGPLNTMDLLQSESYDWLKEPWPWKYRKAEE